MARTKQKERPVPKVLGSSRTPTLTPQQQQQLRERWRTGEEAPPFIVVGYRVRACRGECLARTVVRLPGHTTPLDTCPICFAPSQGGGLLSGGVCCNCGFVDDTPPVVINSAGQVSANAGLGKLRWDVPVTADGRSLNGILRQLRNVGRPFPEIVQTLGDAAGRSLTDANVRAHIFMLERGE